MSDPVASGTSPAASAAPEPPEEPPGALRQVPGVVRRAVQHRGRVEEPARPRATRSAPRALRPQRAGASSSWWSSSRCRPLYAVEACVSGQPSTDSSSLIPRGTPARGPRSSPDATLRSISVAAASARSGSRCTNALSGGLKRSIRSRWCSRTSIALRSPLRTPSAIAVALISCSCIVCVRLAVVHVHASRPRRSACEVVRDTCWSISTPESPR